jgi:hypothetical protein
MGDKQAPLILFLSLKAYLGHLVGHQVGFEMKKKSYKQTSNLYGPEVIILAE